MQNVYIIKCSPIVHNVVKDSHVSSVGYNYLDAAINFTSKITNVFSYVSKLFDEKFVDNFCVLGIAKCIKKKGECFSLIQTGNVRDYIFYSFLSLCLIIGVFFII